MATQNRAQAQGRGYGQMEAVDDSEKRLQDAMRSVEDNAFFMNSAIDKNDLDEALKNAVKMLRELRSGSFSPRSYYELWMKIFDRLRNLHTFFLDVNAKGMPMAELYQKVQSTNHIIPRLYLMITVGSAFVMCREAPSKDILMDLIEMLKGVQHPLRGLFLRNYLLKMTHDKLTEEYEIDAEFCVSFILQNFGEMNRLWVRMQHQGAAKLRPRREKERQELKVLISFNLVRLSECEGLNLEFYRVHILDRVLDLIANCKDKIAQQYLLDVTIQVFPVAYHIATLDKFLSTFEHLEAEVDIKSILISLMERFKYDEDEDENGEETDEGVEKNTEAKERVPSEIFDSIRNCIEQTISKRKGTTVEDTLDIQIALLDFVVACYPGQIDYINTVLGFCAKFLEESVEQQEAEGSVNVVDILVLQLLKVPLKQKELSSVDLLELSHYPSLIDRLSWASKRKFAHGFLQHVLAEKDFVLDSEDMVTKLLYFILPLVKDDEDGTADQEAGDSAVFEEQQESVAKFIHRIDSQDPSTLFKILGIARKHFGKGGVKRIRFTLPPLCFRYFILVDKLIASEKANKGESAGGDDAVDQVEKEEEMDAMKQLLESQKTGGVSLRKVFQYLHEIISALAGVVELQNIALRMFLQAAMSADRAKEQEVAYEFMAQAFTLYEDIADTKEQLTILPQLIGTVQKTTVFDKESYETLATKTTQYAARLLKKTDQCKMIVKCSHLFWSLEPKRELRAGEQAPPPGADPKRALECLQKSLKIADSCIGNSLHVSLFVEILNRYVYFFVNGMEKISAQNVSDLIALIKGNLAEVPSDSEDKAEVEIYFNNTISHLKTIKSKHPEDERYAALDV